MSAINDGVKLFVATAGLAMLYSRFMTKKRTRQGKCVTVSAPGKVLVAGGYLVLERPNIGVVVAATARFYSTIKVLSLNECLAHASKDKLAAAPLSPLLPKVIYILVDSPQFYTQYVYSYNIDDSALAVLGKSTNEFVETCLTLTLSFIKKFLGAAALKERCSAAGLYDGNALGMKLRADNDFYSQIKEVCIYI
jgi:phosphomevalonate kinase